MTSKKNDFTRESASRCPAPNNPSPREETARDLLRQSEDRYRAVFENTGTATFVKEDDMTISMVNTGFADLTGYDKSEVEGKIRWPDLIYHEDRARLIQYHLARRESRDAPTEMECRIVDKSGHVKEVYLKLDLIPGTRQSIGSFMDISRLKSAEKEILEGRALLGAIVEAFEGLLYVSSPDYRIRFMNENYVLRLGRDATGETCYRALHQRETVCPFCVMDQVRKGETVRFDLINPMDRRWYHSMNAPIRHVDGTISLMALINDINQRKLAEAALRHTERYLRQENIRLRSSIKERHKFGNIVGKSPAMQGVYEQILNAAAASANVIIYGEPGTGKELVAHAIHDMSERRGRRIVPVHCGAIPENLFESEFFGYRKGAFSGADADRQGYIDFADGGTLFLDEVGEISPHMQVKLLRVIEGGGYTPVGSNQVKHSDVRIIAATNRDLSDRLQKGAVREDFYYRIHILPIYLPPLRDRKEDIPLLVEHFLMLYGGKQNIPPITGHSLEKLMAHDWPGNVRELQNVMIRYITRKTVDLDASPGTRPVAPAVNAQSAIAGQSSLQAIVEAYEKQVIKTALSQQRWHRSRVARAFGIDRKTLFNKMRKYNLTDENV